MKNAIELGFTGVALKKEFFDNDYNRRTIIPITTAQTVLFGQTYLDSINVYVADSELVDIVTLDIEELLLEIID